jgi:hypothetical protein
MKIKQIPIHPFLFSLYPPISLLAYNIDEINIIVGLRSVIITFVSASVLYLLTRVFIRNWNKAALTISLTIGLVLIYGHFYNSIKNFTLFNIILGRHRILLPFWILLFFLGLWLIFYRIQNPKKLSKALNIFAFFLLIIPVYQISAFEIRKIIFDNIEREPISTNTQTLNPPEQLPDVYYIILDAYGRDDSLLEIYNYDNSPFLESLSDLGFYIAYCSRTNYAKTRLSLTSSLNMNYLEAFGLTKKEDYVVLTRFLYKNNEVRKKFEHLGYTIISFKTLFNWTEWRNSDIFLTRGNDNLQILSESPTFSELTEYEVMYLKTTIFRAFFDLTASVIPKIFLEKYNSFVFSGWEEAGRQNKVETINFIINRLPTLVSIPNPKFVFVHLLVPHPPSVFKSNGEYLSAKEEKQLADGGYIGQLAYTNDQILEVVNQIISTSTNPPIIILQGDHGPRRSGSDDPRRLNILNAYFFPGSGSENLYPNITPVNSFRVLFDSYFNTSYGLIDDISYFSDVPDLFDFTIFQETRSGCAQQPE